MRYSPKGRTATSSPLTAFWLLGRPTRYCPTASTDPDARLAPSCWGSRLTKSTLSASNPASFAYAGKRAPITEPAGSATFLPSRSAGLSIPLSARTMIAASVLRWTAATAVTPETLPPPSWMIVLLRSIGANWARPPASAASELPLPCPGWMSTLMSASSK